MAKITQINVDLNSGMVTGQYTAPPAPGVYPSTPQAPQFFTLPVDVVLAAAETVKAIGK